MPLLHCHCIFFQKRRNDEKQVSIIHTRVSCMKRTWFVAVVEGKHKGNKDEDSKSKLFYNRLILL